MSRSVPETLGIKGPDPVADTGGRANTVKKRHAGLRRVDAGEGPDQTRISVQTQANKSNKAQANPKSKARSRKQ